jgi:hypothetical protein
MDMKITINMQEEESESESLKKCNKRKKCQKHQTHLKLYTFEGKCLEMTSYRNNILFIATVAAVCTTAIVLDPSLSFGFDSGIDLYSRCF